MDCDNIILVHPFILQENENHNRTIYYCLGSSEWKKNMKNWGWRLYENQGKEIKTTASDWYHCFEKMEKLFQSLLCSLLRIAVLRKKNLKDLANNFRSQKTGFSKWELKGKSKSFHILMKFFQRQVANEISFLNDFHLLVTKIIMNQIHSSYEFNLNSDLHNKILENHKIKLLRFVRIYCRIENDSLIQFFFSKRSKYSIDSVLN